MLHFQQIKHKKSHSWLRSVLQNLNLVFICIALASTLFVWGVFLLWERVDFSNRFQFRHIVFITQTQHVKPKFVVNLVQENLQGGFFSLNTDKIRQALKTEPWISEVSFRRVWPDRLEVGVVEQQPVALWGENSLVNVRGEIFSPPVRTFPDGLPKLNGPQELLPELLNKIVEFQQLLSDKNIIITELSLSPLLSWRLVLDGHLEVILGQQDIDLAFSKFISLYEKIIMTSSVKAKRVDLRYPNGAAILWEA